MDKIEAADEFTRDWDWYACDQVGNIAHFTTAGLRSLPRSVKLSSDALERITHYLGEEREAWSEWSIRPGVEAEVGWKDAVSRDRFLHSFVEMARAGIFSYNPEMRRGPNAKYYLVAKPDNPLRVNDLPVDIGTILLKTQASISFSIRDYITESETLDW